MENLTFQETLTLILVGLLFFKEQMAAWISKWLGIKKEEAEVVPPWAESLMTYFNHDTTGHHEETRKKLDKVLETATKNHELLKQFDKFGVPCRDKK